MSINFNVVMLAYNSESTIELAILGVHDHVDKIIVVDGLVPTNDNALAGGHKDISEFSIDKTEYICKKYSNVTYIKHSNTRGHKANAALKHVSDNCNFIWIIDSDEIYNPTRIPQLKKFLETMIHDHGGFSVQYVVSYHDVRHYLDCSNVSFDKKCELCYATRIWQYKNGFKFKADSQEALYDNNGKLYKPTKEDRISFSIGRRNTLIIPDTIIEMIHMHNLRLGKNKKERIIATQIEDETEYVKYTNGGKTEWLEVNDYPEDKIPYFMKG